MNKPLFFVLSFIKALWSAFFQVVWGICTLFLLSALITYYKQDATAILQILIVASVVTKNWLYFFGVIALWELIVNYNSIPKVQVVNAPVKSKLEVKL